MRHDLEALPIRPDADALKAFTMVVEAEKQELANKWSVVANNYGLRTTDLRSSFAHACRVS
jgi:hypothetical protein